MRVWPRTMRTLLPAAALPLLLIIHAYVLLSSALADSQTIDEVAHLAAGVTYLATGDFRLNYEHPPLEKLLAGAAALSRSPHIPLEDPSWSARNEWDFGRAFLYHNTVPYKELLLAGRLPTIFFSIALVLLVYVIGRTVGGPLAGLLAASFAAFDPNMIGHGHLVTNDVPLAFTFLLSIWTFWRYLASPTKGRLLVASLALAVAIITKFNAVFLLPIFIALFLWYRWRNAKATRRHTLTPRWWAFLVMIACSFLVIWMVYGFEVKIPLSDPKVVEIYERQAELENSPALLAGERPLAQFVVRVFDRSTTRGQIIFHLAQTVPIPAFSYVKGLTTVTKHNYYGHESYLLGATSKTGWPTYFPIAFLVKTSTVALLLFAATLLVWLFPRLRRYLLASSLPKTTLPVLVLPPLVFFALAVESHINLGIRHILPVYPFLYLLAACTLTPLLARAAEKKSLLLPLGVALIVIVLAITAFRAHPLELGYFNDFVGGWKNGHKYLLDSNLDWGQDLARLAAFEQEKGFKEIAFAYFGSAEILPYGVRFHRIPTDEEVASDGIPKDIIAISKGVLFSDDVPFHWLRAIPPTDSVGTSIWVYDFRKKETSR